MQKLYRDGMILNIQTFQTGIYNAIVSWPSATTNSYVMRMTYGESSLSWGVIKTTEI